MAFSKQCAKDWARVLMHVTLMTAQEVAKAQGA